MRRPLAASPRSGITLIEILISILILGVGMISLATLFPLGLLRMRDAQRSVRSTYLIESAMADLQGRNLLSKDSFQNPLFSPWYSPAFTGFPQYDPWITDTPVYRADAYAAPGGATADPNSVNLIPGVAVTGEGLPVAYDPLWRYVTSGGYYIGNSSEARFASGIGFVRNDPNPGGFSTLPSAHGLQRVTNFNPLLSNAASVTSIFVSPEDYLFQEANQATQDINGNVMTAPNTTIPQLQPVPTAASTANSYGPSNDWRFTWMFTGRRSDSISGTCLFGDIVIFENRPFAVDMAATPLGGTQFVVAGEPVVEAVFGFSGSLTGPPGASLGYGRGSDRVVVLRWPSTTPDPEVRVGSWIADVTYERNQGESNVRFLPSDYPAQRCYWYQVVKKSSVDDETNGSGLRQPGYRAMTVWVATPLKAKTLLAAGSGNSPPQPVHVNAALVSPYVVNVVPKTVNSR